MGGTQKGRRVELPEGFEARVTLQSKKSQVLAFDAIYMTWDRSTVYLNYAGENADKSYTTFQLPSDPDTLRALAQHLEELADEFDE